ncbi:MAG TPA: TetR family transcriptional regulator [Candidatus Acidoferrales bacterium]|jgi:AcrR family transcriptional regulator|nr:TetR family transcriptional regulator [Candidatus Acidoferrales bacterium]
MPRTADARLEGRILDAAYQLWSRGGERALTMRAVARTARTTTPTVYQRFRDKRDILELLRKRAQEIMFSYMRRAHSAEEFCLRYFEFALRHGNEYELIHADWAVRLAKEEPRPSFDLLKKSLADRLGGTQEQHAGLALALAALLHGTATLLLTKGVPERIAHELRHACVAAFETLVENAAGRSFRPNHRRAARP